ncbi:hypothetical protein FC43_GL000223 [Limosilactobacillus ingluviei DSM 15946]|uniref:Uncharacterized protein n=1 Tax=Limosilactobacillus ingluviei DSM 15946 TaxID=1423760 RepID=A0A0R1UB22_9LACO|nr:hypothetical protein FC43_GL000223 [Limosilactobacillus ingluviei DSM 15946]
MLTSQLLFSIALPGLTTKYFTGKSTFCFSRSLKNLQKTDRAKPDPFGPPRPVAGVK